MQIEEGQVAAITGGAQCARRRILIAGSVKMRRQHVALHLHRTMREAGSAPTGSGCFARDYADQAVALAEARRDGLPPAPPQVRY